MNGNQMVDYDDEDDCLTDANDGRFVPLASHGYTISSTTHGGNNNDDLA